MLVSLQATFEEVAMDKYYLEGLVQTDEAGKDGGWLSVGIFGKILQHLRAMILW